jgi:ArsR family transcriptional regulator
MEAETEIARVCKALGHPMRVRILRLLMEKCSCVCGDLVDELPLAQSTVSQHLKVLKQAGLVKGEIDGPRRCYCVDPDALARFRELVNGFGLGLAETTTTTGDCR